ncbi:unnamed protein product [Cyprideis torosa]|uniref:Uncharacterized protein n=1 Tax=Cyprideis torosa TaxID=163714 RepID=A0A7R8ZUE2_9CRUS|nr:unnamed protein product [Cyprideis torosa]CAG0900398.1 unnamed protein product [Cyprideis torosa]
MERGIPWHVKALCLSVLSIMTSATVLILRYSRSHSKERYIANTVVVMTEVAKVACCLLYICASYGFNFRRTLNTVKREVLGSPRESSKLIVPSSLYLIQNNLLFIALSNLDAATYQVTYQLKILTTAFFSYVMLEKRLSGLQILSLCCMMLGVCLVQTPAAVAQEVKDPHGRSPVLGLVAVLAASLSSGFAGVYFEKLVKTSSAGSPSLPVRNMQLALFSVFFGAFGLYFNDWKEIQTKGFFYAYSTPVLLLILLNVSGRRRRRRTRYLMATVIFSTSFSNAFFQSLGGILISVTIKYADNILKGFAAAMSIILSSIVSWMFLGDLMPTTEFSVGASLVVVSIVMYGYGAVSRTLPSAELLAKKKKE